MSSQKCDCCGIEIASFILYGKIKYCIDCYQDNVIMNCNAPISRCEECRSILQGRYADSGHFYCWACNARGSIGI